VEQYLIVNLPFCIANYGFSSQVQRYWNYSSLESITDQRKRLVHEHMQLEDVPEEWDPTNFNLHPSQNPNRIPTAEEITTILKPWHSDDLRRRAWEIWCGRDKGPPVVLRTYYGNGDEGGAQLTEYIEASATLDMEADWAVLNNAERFDFGSDWRRVFSVLPEIAGCRESFSRLPVQVIVDGELPDVKSRLRMQRRRIRCGRRI
jgi:hypothetical protein